MYRNGKNPCSYTDSLPVDRKLGRATDPDFRRRQKAAFTPAKGEIEQSHASQHGADSSPLVAALRVKMR